jgi:hypothetical protein
MLRALLARVSPLGDQPIELAYTNLFVFEQAPQRIKLNRIVLMQDFRTQLNMPARDHL